MSLIDDARRIEEIDPTYEDDGYVGLGRHVCVFCGTWAPDHGGDCPWLSLPQIVAALEAAEKIVGVLDEDGPTDNGRGMVCRCCGVALATGYHDADCPWQALVTALKGDQ